MAASLFLGFVFTAPVFATSNPKKTAVVGFVNLGNFEDNYYNDLATLAIIDYLKSVDGIEVADYKMIRSANRKTGFTKLRQQDITVALKSAKSAKSRYAVFGEYKTSASNATITFTVYYYEVKNSKKIASETFTGKSGQDVFLTIARIKEKIEQWSTGKTVSLVKYTVLFMEQGYFMLYINKKLIGTYKFGDKYFAETPENCALDIEIKAKTGESLFTKTIAVKKDGDNKVVFALPGKNNPSEMIFVEGGEFKMGNASGDADEKTVRTVKISSFYISKTEVTCAEWLNVMETRVWDKYISQNVQMDYPAFNMTWYEAVDYCNRRSLREGLKPAYIVDKTHKDPQNTNSSDTQKWLVTIDALADGYRLPTEAEWEYAARGGKLSKSYKYSGSDLPGDSLWYIENSGKALHSVGKLKANELGICDMSGNVTEWCFDWYAPYDITDLLNPVAKSKSEYRTLRGGSYIDKAQDCRITARNKDGDGYPTFENVNRGFRLVRTVFANQTATNAITQSALLPKMIEVVGGKFRMGSETGDADERPVREVVVDAYRIGCHEVTRGEWRAVMHTEPWKNGYDGYVFTNDDRLPVANIQWYQTIEFCNTLSAMAGLRLVYLIDKTRIDPNNTNQYDTLKWTIIVDKTANGFRLPTEAEWEFAARGGSLSKGYQYSGSDLVGEVAYTNATLHSVGSKKPNELGIYDMSGNVSEWCWDWYAPYNNQSVDNPAGAIVGEYKTLRGGGYFLYLYEYRVTSRNRLGDGYPHFSSSDRGFRLAQNGGSR